MDPDQQLRNLRDFLLVYNRMTEICFQRCSSNFNYRNLTMDEEIAATCHGSLMGLLALTNKSRSEERCVDSCAGKLIRSNHRLMNTYVQLMPRMVQRRMEEMEIKAAENAKAAEAAAASGALGPSTTEASPASETLITTSPAPQISPPLPPSVTDVGSASHGSVLKSAGLDIPVDFDAALSKPSAATEVKLAAAIPLTPATDMLYPLTLDKAGPSTEGFPQPSIAGAHIEPVPVFTPSNPMSLTADTTITSKPKDILSGPARVPDIPPMSGE